MVLETGAAVPRITLPSSSGTNVSLMDIERGVLYFYPKDMTPGCTIEACSFSDANERIENTGWRVYGISTDDMDRHQRFIEKHNLTFELLSDVDHAAAEAFGVWTEKSMFGKSFFGTKRVTFAVENGKVVHVWPKVSVQTHAEDVLDWIQSRP